jgi:two-component system phosphate regulon sensor histidine kinase PhoR
MRERIRTLEAETATMAQMVAEMLELARIEGAGPALHLDDVSLGEIASGTVERLRPFAERSGVILEASVREPLPAVRGEAARLAQVAANLVHNAVKFSPVGGHVRVEVRAESGSAILTVADEGIGIAAADQQRIFERFYKADRSRSKAGGTGLGLAIARHIVEAHGGTIGVQSVEGSGATFTVTLPTANSVRAIRPRARSGPTESISTAR